MNYQAKHV